MVIQWDGNDPTLWSTSTRNDQEMNNCTTFFVKKTIYTNAGQWRCFIDFQFTAEEGRKKFFVCFAKFCDWLIKLVRATLFWSAHQFQFLHQCKNIGAFTEFRIFAKYLESWKYVWWMCALNLQIHIYVWNSQSKYLKGCLRWDYMCVTTCCVKR